MTSKLNAKFLELFKSFKSDALPKPPREETSSESSFNSETANSAHIHDNLDNDLKNSKKKSKAKSFTEPNRDSTEFNEDDEDRRSSNVNTQAAGNVINIVNSKNVHCGNVYNMGSAYNGLNAKTNTMEFEDEEVEKTNYIKLLLEAVTKPEHEYIDYISKNLGKNWYNFFRKLGYKQGWIETFEMDMAKNGIAEVRYKLLLDWIRNDEDGSLGKLATILWESGERAMVKEMAAMYTKG